MKDDSKLTKRKRKSILNLGGIAKDRKIGSGNEREYTKKTVSKRITGEYLKRMDEDIITTNIFLRFP